MRPTTIMSLLTGLLIAMVGVVTRHRVIFDRTGGKFWFYWIAPLLMLGFALMMLQPAVGYWMRVGRLEAKGRPRE